MLRVEWLNARFLALCLVHYFLHRRRGQLRLDIVAIGAVQQCQFDQLLPFQIVLALDARH